MQRRYWMPSIGMNRWLVIIFFLLLMEVIVRNGLINKLFVPLPTQTLQELFHNLIDKQFLVLIGITLFETAVAFLVSTVVGVALGYLLWKLPNVGKAYEPLIAGLFSSPIILLYPIFLVIFGRSYTAVIVQGIAMGILPIILYTRQAFLSVSPALIKVGRSMNLPQQDIFRHILFPAAAPSIFTGMRLGLTYMLISIISMEYITQLGGLGKAVADNHLRFRIPELYSAIVFVVLLSVFFIYITYRGEQMVKK
jgi:NitT/TauT family transport system permease protein